MTQGSRADPERGTSRNRERARRRTAAVPPRRTVNAALGGTPASNARLRFAALGPSPRLAELERALGREALHLDHAGLDAEQRTHSRERHRRDPAEDGELVAGRGLT